jgi:replicative DNA helicase
VTETASRLPSDAAAERAVLGAVLSDPEVWDDVSGILRPHDFFEERHAAIFEACESLQHATPPKPIDTLTVATELKTLGKLQTAGGQSYLVDLVQSVATTANAKTYASTVGALAIRRRLVGACGDIQRIAVEPTETVEGVLDEAQRRIFEIAERHHENDLVPFNEVLEKTLDTIDRLRDSGGGITGLPTGFIDLDKKLTGLHAGEFIVLAARPSCGKTSLALNMAAFAALHAKRPVAVFSLEMPSDQLAMRMLASEARVDVKRLREGSLSQANMEKLQHAAAALYNAKLYVDDSGTLSSFDLRTKARRLQSQLGGSLGLIVVDYLQLMHQHHRTESRQQEVQEISRSLKSLAKELGVPVLALSQLNRRVEERRVGGGRPVLSDLRESGAIEQDADVVMFIHRTDAGGDEEVAAGPGAAGAVELIVAKQRNGPTGTVELIFLPEYTRFENRARQEPYN